MHLPSRVYFRILHGLVEMEETPGSKLAQLMFVTPGGWIDGEKDNSSIPV
jgi:hypothetical protein